MEPSANKKKQLQRFEGSFRKELIRTVKCYPCLYDQHNEGYGLRSVQREVWEQVAITCARPSHFCERFFEDLLLRYGEMHVRKMCFSLGLRAAKVSSKKLKDMKYFKPYIPMQKVKQRLVSNPRFTEADRMLIMNFEDGLQSSPDIEELRQPPGSNYAPAFQTNSVQPTRAIQPIQRQVRTPTPSAPQSSGTNTVESVNSNPHSWQSPEYTRHRNQVISGDEVSIADIEQFFGDISRKTVQSRASSEDFLEIQSIILNILAEKLPQYNSK